MMPLPFLNDSDHMHYTDYYSRESWAAVAELYRQDIESFGYSFGE